MKLKVKIVAIGLVLGCSAFSKEPIPVDDWVVRSVYELESLFVEQQYQFLPISPPSEEIYIHPHNVVIPVDWKKFPKELTSQMYAEMDANGYPIYRVSIYEDPVTRETVFLNSYGAEIYKIEPIDGYDPYAWQKIYFNLESGQVLDELRQWIYDPAHIAADFTLIPELFHADYLATQQEESMLEASMIPMMMAMSSGGVTKLMASMSVDTNELVILDVSLPETFGVHLEIFFKDDLIYDSSWEVGVGTDWISTYGGTNIFWTDPASSNQSARFYMLSDADIDTDGDGFSDLREAYISGTESNIFNWVNVDGDDMHDWYELLMFGNLNQVSTGDFDGDGLLNNEEMVFVSGAVTNVTVHSDPSLSDTDDDGRNDFVELRGTPPTDPWNNDVSAPVATMIWPTNNFVMVP